MRIMLAVVVAALAVGVTVTGLEDAGPEPLELKLAGQTECAAGWRAVSVDRGWIEVYPLPGGRGFPNWIADDRLVAAHTRPDGRVDLDALAETRRRLRPQPRAVCRWEPLSAAAAPAD